MNKKELVKGYSKEEQLIIAKLLDKKLESEHKNKITNTFFLDRYQQKICLEILMKIKCENYIEYGGNIGSERKIIIFYPEKLKFLIENRKFQSIICAIRVNLPSELKDQFTHKDYLGMLMKLGVERKAIGDIIVTKEGADIIILPYIEKYLITNLKEFTRLKKAKIVHIKIDDVKNVENNFIEYKIILTSLRIDNIIAGILKISRTKAKEILMQERVFVNFKNETKLTRQVEEKDIISIRGKGRYKIGQIIGNTRKGRYILKIEKYV